jgi:hypothetical protein
MNRLLLGFLVAGTALGGSAFKNVESHATVKNGNALSEGYFVQTDINRYSYVSTTTAGQGICMDSSPNHCKYYVPEGSSIPNTGPYTEAQLQNFGLSPSTTDKQVWIAP